MKHYLYRVVITEYPAGGQPEGWSADEVWISRFHTTDFFWPSTKHDYKSRSGAMARAQLIESYGAKAVVQRSNPITWPEEVSE